MPRSDHAFPLFADAQKPTRKSGKARRVWLFVISFANRKQLLYQFNISTLSYHLSRKTTQKIPHPPFPKRQSEGFLIWQKSRIFASNNKHKKT